MDAKGAERGGNEQRMLGRSALLVDCCRRVRFGGVQSLAIPSIAKARQSFPILCRSPFVPSRSFVSYVSQSDMIKEQGDAKTPYFGGGQRNYQ